MSELDDTLLFDNQICFPIYSAANSVVRAYTPLLKKLDLTYLQYMVLMLLWQEPNLMVKEIGQRVNLDSGTLTPLLKRLEAKGFVIRTRGKDDERVRMISITKKGMAIKENASSIPTKLACSIGLSREKSLALKSLCQELLATLNKL